MSIAFNGQALLQFLAHGKVLCQQAVQTPPAHAAAAWLPALASASPPVLGLAASDRLGLPALLLPSAVLPVCSHPANQLEGLPELGPTKQVLPLLIRANLGFSALICCR